MNVTVKFFASVREQLGTAEERLSLPEGISTVGELRDLLVRRGGAWEEALGGNRALRMACNQAMCNETAPLESGAEIAFFPPVTGG
ncbi:molybdopterin converting factor subunit 1 [Pseudoduganella sp. GCM10020061]|uniref:molybdopterin converting factor subunit 1 n=1 Tax=Pseudoduganella sp. GCM10020061 TaxID=3317345 RepID=UPI00362F44C7